MSALAQCERAAAAPDERPTEVGLRRKASIFATHDRFDAWLIEGPVEGIEEEPSETIAQARDPGGHLKGPQLGSRIEVDDPVGSHIQLIPEIAREKDG